VQIRSQDLLSDEAVSIVAMALKVHREDIERGALLSINEGGTRARMLPLKGSQVLRSRNPTTLRRPSSHPLVADRWTSRAGGTQTRELCSPFWARGSPSKRAAA
jgi:hypothetical protein